ncbi:MAG: DUF2179 domain-containing protein [Anaerolineales bacterium]|nr:DUF2179 domain-containing protein [Chloroflexota bacterium]MBL6980302.1 DUF2179 domain-containing protein [Anaerolineales bacterium]
MDIDLSVQALLGALLIFGLRVTDMTFDTLRVLFVMRGRKPIVWFLGFCQSAIFVIAITSVLSNLDNPINIIGYAAGFATGNVVGIFIEERLAIGFIHLQIISPRFGSALGESLREEGFAVTEVPARGKDGMVTMLNCNIRRKQVSAVEKLIYEVDGDAFITASEIRSVRRGFWRS